MESVTEHDRSFFNRKFKVAAETGWVTDRKAGLFRRQAMFSIHSYWYGVNGVGISGVKIGSGFEMASYMYITTRVSNENVL